MPMDGGNIMNHSNSRSDSYAAAGVDITAGYKAVELMKEHIARTNIPGVVSGIGGFGKAAAVFFVQQFPSSCSCAL